ncbi:MAG TPA: rhodanese-like domain-containing protein, partial [Candidatus Binatia bacterium]|nr:rhodanese-like domain-containing protein [Candidatus Binatia bacterium]
QSWTCASPWMSRYSHGRDRRALRRFPGIATSFSTVRDPTKRPAPRVALLLRAKGITRVRPLEGGIDAWLADNFPFVTESLVKKPVEL